MFLYYYDKIYNYIDTKNKLCNYESSTDTHKLKWGDSYNYSGFGVNLKILIPKEFIF